MPLEEAAEKFLGEMFSLVMAGAPATNKNVQRITIGRTQVSQCFSGRGSVSGLGHQDGSPMSSVKAPGGKWSVCAGFGYRGHEPRLQHAQFGVNEMECGGPRLWRSPAAAYAHSNETPA